jgi:uncharacterized protein
MKPKHFLFLMLIMICQIAWGLDIPRLKGRVNDYSGTLSAAEIIKLEAKLKAFEDSTSNQIVILLMESLDGEDLEDFSMEVAENWKIGQKGKDNGVILLFFMEEKKDRIEVGYGLESVLTDATCTWILDEEVEPLCKEKKYCDAINVAIDKIILSTTGEYQKQIAPAMEQKRKSQIAFIVFVALAFLAGVLGYAHWTVSGITGGIGSPILWFLVFGALSISAFLITLIVGILGGLLAHIIMSGIFGGGVTGSDFGDGIIFSGGGDGGGGFSGGGGGFGGGGASGGW